MKLWSVDVCYRDPEDWVDGGKRQLWYPEIEAETREEAQAAAINLARLDDPRFEYSSVTMVWAEEQPQQEGQSEHA